MQTLKNSLKIDIKKWLAWYLTHHYSKTYDICITIPNNWISKLPDNKIKSIANYSSFVFKPDILGILTSKQNRKNTRLIFVNRSENAISLKEIGELLCYSRIANPLESILLSPKSIANEVNLILLDRARQENILKYNSGYIKIGNFNNGCVDFIYPH